MGSSPAFLYNVWLQKFMKMTKLRLLFTFIAFPCLLWGQPVDHFLQPDSRWHVARTFPAATPDNPNFVATVTDIYGFQGDSLLDGVQWYKLYSTRDSLFQENLLFQGLVRAEASKVFFRDTLNQIDTLYNFSLNVGDSVLFKLNGQVSEWLHITAVETIEIEGGNYKYFSFSEPTVEAFDALNEHWIEGIGSIHGPLFPRYPKTFSEEIPDSMLVSCTFSDGSQIWHHPAYTNCYIDITLHTGQVEKPELEIYPNPFSDGLQINNLTKNNLQIIVLNNLGQPVKQRQLKVGIQQLDLSGLDAGIYFIRLSDERSARTIKLVKQN